MAETLEFLFDFGSPNAYLVHRALPDFSARTGAQITYLPVLLGGIFKATGNQPPMVTLANVPAKLQYERQEMQRFIALHGLDKFQFHPHFPVNTLLLMRGAVAADQAGILAEYVEVAMVAMWENGLRMDNPDVFSKTLTVAGLDGSGLLEKTQSADVKNALIANTDAAVARGVFGIPTFFVGDEMFFGKERLLQIEKTYF